jgi:hypothetical protein
MVKEEDGLQPTRRLAIYLRDGFLCAYCGTDLHSANRRDVTLDHLVAQIHGGSHHESNLVTACHTCNSKRQHKPWRAFCAPGAVERILRNRTPQYRSASSSSLALSYAARCRWWRR